MPLQIMVLTKELGVFILAAKLERSNVDALEPLFEGLERLGERKQHQDALERLEQVLCVLVLPGQFDSQVDKTWRFNELDETAKGDKLWCVHFDLREPRDQTVG